MAMSESEAIEYFYKQMENGNIKNDTMQLVYERAIDALEEIQQYRAIGTVEELKSMKENGSFSGLELAQIVAKLNKLKEYEAIGTVSEFRELKEKATAIKALGARYSWDCPCCGTFHSTNGKYCSECGQVVELD